MDTKKSTGLTAARIIIEGGWEGEIAQAKRILYHAAEKWKQHKYADILLTPGGFIQFTWPNNLPEVGTVLHPNPDAVDDLIRSADHAVNILFPSQLTEKIKPHTRLVVVGVDSTPDNERYQIELTCALDLKTGIRRWTGKSYPDQDQISKLIRNENLESHFIDLNDRRVLILGCHDLNIFNNRWESREKLLSIWRCETRVKMKELLSLSPPSAVLHLAHTIDSVGTWRNGWNGLQKRLPSDTLCVSSGCYYRKEGCRNSLREVQYATIFNDDSLDFIGAVGEGGGAYIKDVTITSSGLPATVADTR